MNPNDKKNGWYWEATLSCAIESFEIISYYLFENNASGIEEIDKNKMEEMVFKVYFPAESENPQKIIKDISNHLAGQQHGLKKIYLEKKAFQDWQSNWKKHFKPLPVGKSFLVRPPWEKSFPGKKEIVIHPGFGFGTGYHESTNLALQLLEMLREKHEFNTVIDVGTGSGILTIGAILSGAVNVTAIDIDADALAEVERNMELSGCEKNLCTTIQGGPAQLDKAADLVMANIETVLLTRLIPDLLRLTKNKGFLLLSGILIKEKNDILSHEIATDTELLYEWALNEWCGFLFRRK